MTSPINRPARIGLITDQTGALSFMGIANVNLAKMVTDDINARGGLLGHPVEGRHPRPLIARAPGGSTLAQPLGGTCHEM